MSEVTPVSGVPAQPKKPTPAVPIFLHVHSDATATLPEGVLWKLDGESDADVVLLQLLGPRMSMA